MNSTFISLKIKEKTSCTLNHFYPTHQYKLNTQASDDISLLNDFMNIFKSVYQKNHPFFKYLKIKYHIIINERTERLFSFKFVYPVKNYSSFTYTISINDLKFDNKLLKDLLKDLNQSFNIDMKLNTEEDIITLKKLMTMYYF